LLHSISYICVRFDAAHLRDETSRFDGTGLSVVYSFSRAHAVLGSFEPFMIHIYHCSQNT